MNGPINKGVSSALPSVFSRRSAILKIVEEKALGTRLQMPSQKRRGVVSVFVCNGKAEEFENIVELGLHMTIYNLLKIWKAKTLKQMNR